MEVIFLWVIFSVLVGAYASSKKVGTGFLGGFFVSLILSPLIGVIIVALSSPSEKKLARGMKKGPDCAGERDYRHSLVGTNQGGVFSCCLCSPAMFLWLVSPGALLG